MGLNWPNELSGTHPLASWGNKLLRAAKASALTSGAGYMVRRNAAGTSLGIIQSNSGINSPVQIYNSASGLYFKVTEGYAIASDHSFIPTYAGDGHEFTLTSGVAKFYFCLVFTSPTAASITTSSTLPAWGIDVLPIGWVDTDTYKAETPPRSVIYQFCNENIFSPCVV
jgi:hypothetical protein